MTIPGILKELEPYTGRFPRKAMEAAIEQREAIAPELLRVLETVAEDPVKHAERRGYALHLFAIYLLEHSGQRTNQTPRWRPNEATDVPEAPG